jgi:RNA polymerase sigma-32 factor
VATKTKQKTHPKRPSKRRSKTAKPARAARAARAKPAEREPAAEAEAEAEDEGEDEESDLDDDTVIEASAELIDDKELPSSPSASKKSDDRLARVDTLQVYMREVQHHPLLTPEEEHELAVHYTKSQDVATAAKLVTANLRLVVKIAYEYRRAYRNMMDLIQEGNIGLMQAVKRYDPYRGVKLSSYAAWWIRAYMLRFILNNWRMVKIGTTQAQRKLFFNLSKEKARLSAMGIEPTHAEIAKRLNVEEKDVVEMDRRLSRGDASLDAAVSESDGKTTTRMELMPTSSAGPDAIAEGTELSEIVRQRLDEFRQTLSGKDVAIFDKRLVAEDPMTLQQLGDEFGVSRERVRQLEARLTGKLREFLRQSLGDAVEMS